MDICKTASEKRIMDRIRYNNKPLTEEEIYKRCEGTEYDILLVTSQCHDNEVYDFVGNLVCSKIKAHEIRQELYNREEMRNCEK